MTGDAYEVDTALVGRLADTVAAAEVRVLADGGSELARRGARP
jgi:hypothetical protein